MSERFEMLNKIALYKYSSFPFPFLTSSENHKRRYRCDMGQQIIPYWSAGSWKRATADSDCTEMDDRPAGDQNKMSAVAVLTAM